MADDRRRGPYRRRCARQQHALPDARRGPRAFARLAAAGPRGQSPARHRPRPRPRPRPSSRSLDPASVATTAAAIGIAGADADRQPPRSGEDRSRQCAHRGDRFRPAVVAVLTCRPFSRGRLDQRQPDDHRFPSSRQPARWNDHGGPPSRAATRLHRRTSFRRCTGAAGSSARSTATVGDACRQHGGGRPRTCRARRSAARAASVNGLDTARARWLLEPAAKARALAELSTRLPAPINDARWLDRLREFITS